MTVVDNGKAPRPREAVKLWASLPNTQVILNGQNVTIGPDDSSFATAQTDAGGQLTIVSTATALAAPSLRLWAGFMDPYERIVIHPDEEFHQRVMTAHAQSDSTHPDYADPDTVNLQTAYAYSGTLLFSDEEKSQQLPQQTANAVQQMGSATGAGTTASSGASYAAALGLASAHEREVLSAYLRGARTTTAGSGKYVAYDDLPGMSYFPVNTPALRKPQIATPLGLQLSNDGKGNHAYASLSVADAAAAIDALPPASQSPPWQTGTTLGAAGGAALLGGWSDFWNWLTGWVQDAANYIKTIVVSVAEDVSIGIELVVDGAIKVFKAVLHTLEDVMSAIGSIFVKLAKLILNAVEALSIIFHFGEIKQTHIAMRAELLNRVNGIPGNANYPGIVAAINGSAIPALNQFFGRGEDDINHFFDQLKGYVTGKSINALQGQGTTEHTFYTGTSKTSGRKASRAVQGSWGMKKMAANVGAATVGGASGGSVQQVPQPLVDFFTTFVNRITGDGDLEQAFSDLKADFATLIQPTSVQDFLGTVLVTLLDTLKTLFDAALAITNALLDGLLALAADIVALIFDPATGVMNRTIDIPVISWLYQVVFGEDLTLLNLLTLVAAIPLTLMYRVATGHYPSQDTAAPAAGVAQLQDNPVGASNGMALIMGLFGGLLTVAGGIVSAIGDSFGAESAPAAVGWIEVVIGFLESGAGFPLASGSQPGLYDWSNWGAGLGMAALNIPGAMSFEEPLSKVLTPLLPFLLTELSLGSIALSVVDLVETVNDGFVNDFGLGLTIAGNIPGVINPVKLVPQELFDAGPVIVAVVDGVMGFAVGVLEVLSAFDSNTVALAMERRGGG